jgi:hypothetical protein
MEVNREAGIINPRRESGSNQAQIGRCAAHGAPQQYFIMQKTISLFENHSSPDTLSAHRTSGMPRVQAIGQTADHDV